MKSAAVKLIDQTTTKKHILAKMGKARLFAVI